MKKEKEQIISETKEQKDEHQEFLDELNALCGKRGYLLSAVPLINPNGTLGARIVTQKVKKVGDE